MDRVEFLRSYWRYYLTLEKRFIHTLNYVTLDDANNRTYSNEYASLLQGIGAELDSFFKVYCGFNLEEEKTIADYVGIVLSDYPDIRNQEIVLCTGASIKPFKDWKVGTPAQSLKWWDAYNKIKHSRAINSKKASQGNVLKALAALYLLEMKYLKRIAATDKCIDIPDEQSALFTVKGWDYAYFSAKDWILPKDGDDVIIDAGTA